MTSYLVVFAVAAAATALLTPLVRRVALRVGAVVPPGDRSVHTVPTPTLGGVAIFAGFALAMGVAWLVPGFEPAFSTSEPLGVLLGAAVIFAVGLLDDLRDWSAPAKVAGMVLAASLVQVLGVTMFYFRIPFADLVVLSPDMAFVMGVVWILVMVNAVNLVDGLDGLAAGICAIAAGAFLLYDLRLVDVGLLAAGSLGPLLAVVVAGVCIGFLPWNLHPAKIFMGDSGALLLGLLLASSTILVGGRASEPFSGQTFFFFAPLFIPLVILGVPLVDTAFAVIRRASRRTGVVSADKEHLHHRLLDLGHGHRRAVFILWAWTLLLALLVLVPTFRRQFDAAVPFAIAAVVLVLYTLFHPGVRRRRRDRSRRRHPAHSPPVGDPTGTSAGAPAVPRRQPAGPGGTNLPLSEGPP